jgi:glutathione S-transferase
MPAHTSSQKAPSHVVERFEKEVKRVTGVIDAHLKKTGKPYLVGDKISYADLAWIPWFRFLGGQILLKDWNFAEEFPHFAAWKKSLDERPNVVKIYGRPEFQNKH